ncbi:MAG: DNA polymerase III subunit epsilon [Candidatus Muproteobacteria bacterium RBG_16_62_13]|uniref:DNA polymerase III subunit epsilon n=1 Tax=Candidatus Muproteobacteria bacterium RBG_16_62_13 TaxID=1817756 RepID=A0A1F6SZZ9_9PROT|nr:MAG: DNA polymerase III subunit epsilon [Candidatus Muproteobacteria bacterium RBG_16_62_13]
MRQIVLDTETTGLEPAEGHRIIEIGCVELIGRRLTDNRFHQYINPDREIDAGAYEVHGISNAMLADKPRFRDVARDFLEFVKGAELIIHNAPFDVGFLNHELKLSAAAATFPRVDEQCTIVDTLKLARRLHPGQKNDLDSLCRRYGVDNSNRTLHGALLDAEILADVYLAMTGGQTGLFEELRNPSAHTAGQGDARHLDPNRPRLPVPPPTAAELAEHEAWMREIDEKTGGKCLWRLVGVTNGG